MIDAGFVLVAGELTIDTERNGVQPVAIGIEVILGEVVIPFDVVSLTEVFGLCPGFGLNADEFDVASIRGALDKIVAKFVQELDRGGVFGIKNRTWRGEFGALARGDVELWVILAELSDELV